MAGDRESPEAFGAALDALRRRGCAVLVSGAVGTPPPLCDSLLGSRSVPRDRVVLSLHRDRRVPPGTELISPPSPAVRSATAATQPAAERGAPASLGRLVDRIGAAIRASANRPDPAVLRVCVGQLDTLVEVYGAAAVLRFLRIVLDRVRAEQGMAHAHVGGSVADRDRFTPLFDVTVETRSGPDGTRQQRWHLHDVGIDSGWLRLATE